MHSVRLDGDDRRRNSSSDECNNKLRPTNTKKQKQNKTKKNHRYLHHCCQLLDHRLGRDRVLQSRHKKADAHASELIRFFFFSRRGDVVATRQARASVNVRGTCGNTPGQPCGPCGPAGASPGPCPSTPPQCGLHARQRVRILVFNRGKQGANQATKYQNSTPYSTPFKRTCQQRDLLNRARVHQRGRTLLLGGQHHTIGSLQRRDTSNNIMIGESTVFSPSALPPRHHQRSNRNHKRSHLDAKRGKSAATG